MKWETVEIQKNKIGKRGSFATIGKGGIKLSAAACLLIDNYHDYQYVELLTANEGKNNYVGVRFLKEQTANSLPVYPVKLKGKVMNGAKIHCRSIISDLFGNAGLKNETTKYEVKKDEDADSILIIDLQKQMK